MTESVGRSPMEKLKEGINIQAWQQQKALDKSYKQLSSNSTATLFQPTARQAVRGRNLEHRQVNLDHQQGRQEGEK